MLQAALNGGRTKAEHRAVPITAEELQAAGIACAAAGAHAFHLHPRDAAGAERLDAAVVDAAVAALHDVVRWPVSVTTGAWIEAEARRRVTLVRRWREPDLASVNLSEQGAVEVIRALLGAGIGVEAGVWSVADAELLVRCGLADRIDRVLIEAMDVPVSEVAELTRAIHTVLDRGDVIAPRLQHGEDETAWPLLEDAVRRGIDTRVGLEDVLVLPDGSPAADNAALVAAAVALGAGRD